MPPYAEPLNPNIPAPVMEGINSIGSAIKERLARENKPGVLSYHGFDAWWNGGLRSAPAFHNMHGILTETAAHVYATPRVYDASVFPERFATASRRNNRPCSTNAPGWAASGPFASAIDYMLTVDFAILDLATTRRESSAEESVGGCTSQYRGGAQGGLTRMSSPRPATRSRCCTACDWLVWRFVGRNSRSKPVGRHTKPGRG